MLAIGVYVDEEKEGEAGVGQPADDVEAGEEEAGVDGPHLLLPPLAYTQGE